MKNLLLMLACGVLWASCCTKVGCSYYVEKSLVFSGFSREELDTVLLIRYEPNQGFKNVIDSFVTEASEGYLPFSIINLERQQYAFTVYLPATAQTFFIDQFGYIKVKDCNSCFPARPKEAYMEEFNSYVLNGLRQSGKFITIEK